MKRTRTQEELDEIANRQREWRTFRREFPLTQSELAERLEVSRRTIQAVEAAEVAPHPKTLRRFITFKASLAGRKMA